MARVTIPATNTSYEDGEQISSFLKPFGIWYERWDCSSVSLSDNATPEEILAAFDHKLAEVKANGSYVTADVVSVSPATPGIDAMLAKFSGEHTHSEDEVRFVVRGRGIFHINPVTAPVFAVEMGPGDLINVPAGTRHWFNLCTEKTICTIRLFQDTTGWTPHYSENAVHGNYEPLCFDAVSSGEIQLQSVVIP